MDLINKTTNKILIKNIKIAKNLKDKSIGLIGKKKGEAIYFITRWGIHSFGMEYDLKVLICDDNFIVKKIAKLKANRILVWNPKYRHVFELPFEQYKVSIGDKLRIKK